jgi:hypothetical protein
MLKVDDGNYQARIFYAGKNAVEIHVYRKYWKFWWQFVWQATWDAEQLDFKTIRTSALEAIECARMVESGHPL